MLPTFDLFISASTSLHADAACVVSLTAKFGATMSKSARGGFVRLLAVVSAVGVAFAAAPATSAEQLDFTQLSQKKDQWCWAASGLSIAQFLGAGKDVSQRQFCNLARDLPIDGKCPNKPDELTTVQAGFRALGMNPGEVLRRPVSQSQVKKQIRAGKPIETGIYWTQGGGHAQVIYGISGDTVSYGDPWKTSPRYSEMSYKRYVKNSKHEWAESLLGMG
jgi:hypothetical protein